MNLMHARKIVRTKVDRVRFTRGLLSKRESLIRKLLDLETKIRTTEASLRGISQPRYLDMPALTPQRPEQERMDQRVREIREGLKNQAKRRYDQLVVQKIDYTDRLAELNAEINRRKKR